MRRWLALWIVVVPLAAAGCGKGAAETAMVAGDEAVLHARPEGERYVPKAFATLVRHAAEARAAYDRGNFSMAADLASRLPAEAEQVLQNAAAAREEMNAQWEDLRETLPALISLVTTKLTALSTMRRPPTFITPDQVEEARRTVADANASWVAALSAFNDGNLAGAIGLAADARSRVEPFAKLLEPVVLPPG